MIIRWIGRLSAMAIAGLIGISVASAFTAANTVPASRAGNPTESATAQKLKPSACSGITLTTIVTGSGTFSGTAGNDLILGSSAVDTITGGNGNDCILGGNGNDSLDGGGGTDVCIGGPGTDTFPGSRCETATQ